MAKDVDSRRTRQHRLTRGAEVDAVDLANERFVVYPAEHGSVVRATTLSCVQTPGLHPQSLTKRPIRTACSRWSTLESASPWWLPPLGI